VCFIDTNTNTNVNQFWNTNPITYNYDYRDRYADEYANYNNGNTYGNNGNAYCHNRNAYDYQDSFGYAFTKRNRFRR
jgi:hypothetical protein